MSRRVTADCNYNPGVQALKASKAKYYSKFSGFVGTFCYSYSLLFALVCVYNTCRYNSGETSQ